MPAFFDSGMLVGDSAWHGLGKVIAADDPRRFSIEDSIELAGMNWSVETVPLYTSDGPVTGAQAVVRSDSRTVLGVVGNRYQPLQNAQQFDWFRGFLKSEECAIESCGSLKNNSLVWILAKINRKDMDIGNGDTIRKYLLLTSSHDGSKATSVGFCPIRVVCWNTLSAGLADSRSNLLRVKHTAKQHAALSAIRDTINLVDESFEATASQYRKMAECSVSQSDIRRYVKLVLELADDESTYSTRQVNIVDDIVGRCLHGVGNSGQTAFDAYNGVSEYVTHAAGRNADSRLRSLWYGENQRVNQRAFELALQLAG